MEASPSVDEPKRPTTMLDKLSLINSSEQLLKKAHRSKAVSTDRVKMTSSQILANRNSKQQLIALKSIPMIRDKIPTLSRKPNRAGYASSVRLRDFDNEIQSVHNDYDTSRTLPQIALSKRVPPLPVSRSVLQHEHEKSCEFLMQDSIMSETQATAAVYA